MNVISSICSLSQLCESFSTHRLCNSTHTSITLRKLQINRNGLYWICLSKFIPTYANLGVKHA